MRLLSDHRRRAVVAKEAPKILRFLLHDRTPIFLEYEIIPSARYGRSRPYSDGSDPHAKLQFLFAQYKPAFEKALRNALQYKQWYKKIPMHSVPGFESDPSWLNGYLPPLDAVTLYGFLVQYSPKIYLEIGSGNSTLFARKAIRDQSLKTRIISIDPAPRKEVDNVCDEIIRQPLEKTNLEVFDRLESGDFLFIDSSHYVLPNSDVTALFMDVLHRLKPGVIVHFHDISLPYDYPDEQLETRYSEQYMLAVLLLYAASSVELLQSNAFSCNQTDLYALADPLWKELGFGNQFIGGCSLWLRMK